MLNRRTLLKSAIKTIACGTCASRFPALAQEQPVLNLKPSETARMSLPKDFIGLGYEMSSVATPGLLSASNDRYVRLVRSLGPHGVIRVGGIVADYTRYSAANAAKAEPKDTIITHKLLTQFNGFLSATGWKAIWSLNFAQGTVEEAVLEARAVASTLGPGLLAFELGNEVENYVHGDKPFRPPTFTYAQYRTEYTEWRSKILQAVPDARFAAPDTAASIEWVEQMAADAKGDVQLLTTHYYRGGQKQGTVDQLLHPDPRLKTVTERLHAAAMRSGIPWRMCETNSFFGGGRPGVSDTFVGSLWTLDFMLSLAAGGCSGVNMETGVNQLGFISSYSPIGEDRNGQPRAGAPYYGMLAFATAAQGCDEIQALSAPGYTENLSAYLLSATGLNRSAVLINRTQQTLSLSLVELGVSHVKAMRLIAPSIDSTQGITFAGAEVADNGSWAATRVEHIDTRHVSLPAMSAVVLLSSQ